MEYITYRNIYEANPFSDAHIQRIQKAVEDFRNSSKVNPDFCMTNTTIFDIEVTELPYSTLENIHYHYSHKNNGASIEKEGLKALIGDNSVELDTKKAIYFSVGAEAVLHNWDVWLKWRLNRFNNAIAAGVSCSRELSQNYFKDLWKFALDWMEYLASKEYRSNHAMLKPVFEYEMIELSRCNYYALDITPGIDYPETQEDPKKALSISAGGRYAEEIYGVGVSTDSSNTLAEQWNRFTELGKPAVIEPSRIKRLTANGHDDALSVLLFLYSAYLTDCRDNNKEPAEFALLPQFAHYCQLNA